MRCKPATALIVATLLLMPAVSRAQDLQKDSVWNGVVTGAGIGGAVGLVVAQTTESICSIPDCMALLAVAGAAVGLVVDRSVGHARSVEPGAAVDDPLWNGALIGSGVASAAVLLDFTNICRSPRGCTAEGVFRASLHGAIFGAVVGVLVDAAIPSKAAGTNAGVRTERSRRLALAFGVRF
jgi:hypothetical protein